MKVLVTGGYGFIGSHVVELLIALGHEVVVLDDMSTGRAKNLAHLSEHSNLHTIEHDIRDRAQITPYFAGVDWVFHLAGRADIVPSIEHPDEYYDVNVTGTLNVLEAARAHNVKRFIYAASSSCYGIPEQYPTPENAPIIPEYPYALTKAMGEELVMHWAKVYGLAAMSLRLFNVYGPRSRTSGSYGAVFGVFLAQKLRNSPLTIVGDGEQSRDFTYVTDVARAFVMAAQSVATNQVLNVGSGHHYSVNKLVDLLGGDKVFIPKRPGEPDKTFADTTLIKSVLAWQPEVSFEEGVQVMLSRINDWDDAPIWTPSSIAKATAVWFENLGGA